MRRWIGVMLAVVATLHPPAVQAADAAGCWRRFLTGIGGDERLAENLVRFRFVGHRLQIPAAYVGSWRPRGELGPEDAVRLFAAPPRLAPYDVERSGPFLRPGSHGIMITIFGHPHFLHGQALLDAMIQGYGHVNRDGERDAHGFLVYRPHRPEAAAISGEIHIWPGDPERMFSCQDGSRLWRFPQCVTRRWIGGSLRLEMNFSKALMPQYPMLEAALDQMMGCALDPGEPPRRVWPP